jgi:putative intracellular protease/amidase
VKEAAAQGLPIAAQTSGVLILGDAGVLDGRQYALYSDFVPLVTGGTPKGDGVIQDGNIITSGICPFMGKQLARPDGTAELTQKMITALESNR